MLIILILLAARAISDVAFSHLLRLVFIRMLELVLAFPFVTLILSSTLARLVTVTLSDISIIILTHATVLIIIFILI